MSSEPQAYEQKAEEFDIEAVIGGAAGDGNDGAATEVDRSDTFENALTASVLPSFDVLPVAGSEGHAGRAIGQNLIGEPWAVRAELIEGVLCQEEAGRDEERGGNGGEAKSHKDILY